MRRHTVRIYELDLTPYPREVVAIGAALRGALERFSTWLLFVLFPVGGRRG